MEKLFGGFKAILSRCTGGDQFVQCLCKLVSDGGYLADYWSYRVTRFMRLYVTI